MRAAVLSLPILLALAAAAPAAGQTGVCDVESRRGESTFINANTPYQMAFVPAPVVRCTGGLVIIADSATMAEATKMIEFIGSVSYRDTVKTLTAGYAQYYARDGHVVAQGDVVLTDLESGSIIEAPYLDYYQAGEARPEDLIIMHSGRPRAILVRANASDTTVNDTTIVDADGMEIRGRSEFVGRGNVEIVRAGTMAYGQYAEFVQGGGLLRLTGSARIEGDSLRMAGDSILGETDQDERFRELAAWGKDATLDGEQVDIEAPWIKVLFSEGEVERLIAAVPGRAAPAVIADADTTDAAAIAADTTALPPGPPTAERGPPPVVASSPRPPRDPGEPRARAVSADFRLVADSIDAVLPGRALERVTAVGGAYGERILVDDSLSVGLPEIAQRDWLQGDTIIATFAEAVGVADTAESRVLEGITAVGAPASSVYRQLDDEDPTAGYAISYLIAHRIEVDLRDGEVSDVRADEQVQGVYLHPRRAAEAARDRSRAGGARQ